MAENHEKQGFTFFAFLPPYIGVSGSLVSGNGQISMRSIDWYQKFLISRLAARYSIVFLLRRSKWLQKHHEKTMHYVFCLFTPLYRCFNISRVSQTQDLDEIYRLVSKILNFMPCGSVFDRFCVEALKMVKHLMKIHENLMKIYGNQRKSMNIIWKYMKNL